MSTNKYTRHPHYPEIQISSEEKWRDVVEYEGCYKVSTWGRVKSVPRRVLRTKRRYRLHWFTIPGKILRPGRGKRCGHMFVNLCKENRAVPFGVHRLVLFAFIGPCPEGIQCSNFPDRVTASNRLE